MSLKTWVNSLPGRQKILLVAFLILLDIGLYAFSLSNILDKESSDIVGKVALFLFMYLVIVVVPIDTRTLGSDKISRARKLFSYTIFILFVFLGGLILLSIISGNMGILDRLF
jgi:hypothetical protein